MLNASGSIGWISFVRNSRFCLGPHTWGRSPKMILAPFSHSESSFWESPKIINPISHISCWLLLLAIFDFPSYWLSSIPFVIVVFYCFFFSVIGYQQCCWLSPLLLVIINAVGYHRCFLLLTYPVVGYHSLKLEKPLFALLLHKLHQTCLFHAIAVDISWNEKKWN